MNIRGWNPKEGQAFQGDVAIIPVPDEIKISTVDEIRPIAGRLVLQEGEVTGHHHHVSLDPRGRERHFRSESATATADPYDGASPELRARMTGKAKAPAAGKARMFRDPRAAEEMVAVGLLERSDLCVGFMLVEGGSVVVRHQEHDGIRVPEGRYYVGRQVESIGAEERQVSD